MRTDTVLSFASATKLMTCIAVMRLVKSGKLNLDDDMSPIIPEIAKQEVLVGFHETTGEPQFRKRTNPLKLRYLLTHSAGVAYDAMNPLLRRWTTLNNRTLQTGSTVVDRFTYPDGAEDCFGGNGAYGNLED